MSNKFKAHWFSASSITAYLSCPLGYYYANVFKQDGCKISTVSPHLVLGIAVHNPLELLARTPSAERKDKKLAPEFFRTWDEMSGEKGGFKTDAEEADYKQRGVDMLKRAKANIHHLEGETTFLVEKETELPWMWLSEKDEIILSGKIDWITRNKFCTDVLDFKTGMRDQGESLQLPIYKVLSNHFLQSSEDFKAGYWYLAKSDDPVEKELPSLKDCIDQLMEITLKIKEARVKQEFECPRGDAGCFACRDYRRIVNNDRVRFIGKGTYGSNNYLIL